MMFYTDPDYVLLQRALGILHRMGLEQTGWRGWIKRWYYGAEPLRNDAANLVRESGYSEPQTLNTQLVGADTNHGGGMKFVRRGRRYGS